MNKGNPAEHIVHRGSNIWLGITVIQYTQKTQDRRFLRLAEEIAQAVIHLWDKDAGSGMEGGLDVAGDAAEYNLDAYAFFDLLYKVTGKQQYIQARDKVLGWLVKHTSTSAWSIAALGPEKLEELGMNPDRIMEFSEQIGNVKTSPTQPEPQTIKIKRTAQIVLAFKIMADFYYQKNMVAKARTCELKADTYLAELADMVISRSISGTAYTLFAYYKYNPLMLEQ